MKKVFAVFFAVAAALMLAACGEKEGLRIAYNYNGTSFISYQKPSIYTSSVDGHSYQQGDLLPTWKAIEEELGYKIVDVASTSETNTNDQWTKRLTTGFEGVDLINGSSAANLFEAGADGRLVDLKEYIDAGKMPNFAALLKNDPALERAITSPEGKIYFTPYFDGKDEIELMTMVRIDWIEKLLDTMAAGTGDTAEYKGEFTTATTNPDTLNITVSVKNAAGVARNVNKKYEANILKTLANLPTKTGASMLTAYKNYLVSQYGENGSTAGYEKLSQVFTGVDATYVWDEMVALMHVVKANSNALFGKDGIAVMFPREGKGNRVRSFVRGLMELQGFRGGNAKTEFLYFDNNTGDASGLKDIRFEEGVKTSINNTNKLFNDGLIISNYAEKDKNHRAALLKAGNGFLTYDFNATSTPQEYIDAAKKAGQESYSFQAILPPLNQWTGSKTTTADTNNGQNWFHFTESVRALKNGGFAMTVHAKSNENRLNAAIKLMDQLYNMGKPTAAKPNGEIGYLHLYGPKGWTEGEYEYNGVKVPKFSKKATEEISSLGEGKMTEYLNGYVGSTLGIGHVRGLDLEYQTLSKQGEEGINKINAAVNLGNLHLAGVKKNNVLKFAAVPAAFPLTTQQINTLSARFKNFRTAWGDGEFMKMIKDGYDTTKYDAFYMEGTTNIGNTIFLKTYKDALNANNAK